MPYKVELKAANFVGLGMLSEVYRAYVGLPVGYSLSGVLLAFALFSISVTKPSAIKPPGFVVLMLMLLDLRVGVIAYGLIALALTKESLRPVSRNGSISDSLVIEKHSFMGSNELGRVLTGFLGELSIDIFRDNLYTYYIGDVDPGLIVMDEYTAIRDFGSVKDAVIQNFSIVGTYGPMALIAAAAWWFAGPFGLATTGVWAYYITTTSTKRGDRILSDYHTFGIRDTKITMTKGVYSINHSFMGYEHTLGIGYSDGNSFYSMHHVTRGNNIEINGVPVSPSYVNVKTDTVCYGGQPRIAAVHDGDEVTVALASGRTNTIIPYRSKVSKGDDGLIMFRGNRSTHGTSGSPIFVKREIIHTSEGEENRVETYEFAGCAGWFYDADPNNQHLKDPKSGTEVMHENPAVLEGRMIIQDKDIMQIFDHPGSGKTWKTIPTLVESGLAKYGRVYVTGPSLVVCNEIKRSLEQHWAGKVSLMTSDATIFERGSYARPIVVAAHDTMLDMLTKGHFTVQQRGLWIVDEAHTVSVGTMCLIDHLRDAVVYGKAGSMVELTATGWNLQTNSYELKDGSNYAIEDIIADEREMLKMMYEDAVNDKVVVFVEKIRGKGNTMEKLSERAKAKGIPFVNLSRQTFDTNYEKAKALNTGMIFTTDIAECGANFGDVYSVYDFQKSPKMIYEGPVVTIDIRAIDAGQSIQRRGRTGRVGPGRYISPGLPLRPFDHDRVEYRDRRIYCETRGIQCLEPRIGDSDVKLSAGQAAAWIGGGMKKINSPILIQSLYHYNGRPKSTDEIRAFVKDWLTDGKTTVQIDGQNVSVKFWDDRDRFKLEELYHVLNATPTQVNSLASYLKELMSKSKSDLAISREYTMIQERDSERDEDDSESDVDDMVI